MPFHHVSGELNEGDAFGTVVVVIRPVVEYEDAIDRLMRRVRVGVLRVDELAWTEIDFEEDLRRAREVIAPKLRGAAA